jgi:flagellar hook-associated protein 1 FlgK
MLGLFGTLNMASRSLQAQMSGIEVTGQNLSNVNTTGYSRQTVQITSSPDLVTSIGPEGTGADATSIQQVVSSLLNNQIQSQNSTSGYWNGQQTGLQTAQDAMDEFLNGAGSTDSTSSSTSTSTSDTGLDGQLSALFSAFSGVATSPTSVAARQSLVAQAQTVATSFNNISTKLDAVKTALNSSLSDGVTSANQLLTQIATLNSQITTAQQTGGNANDLKDAREQDLENLSQLTNITTSSGSNGTVNVTIGGQTLVSGNTVDDTLQTYDPGNGGLLVQTATGQVNLTLTGGSMAGTIDARDGTLATLQANVNTLASSLITQVNTISGNGYGLTGTTGNNLFNGTNASTITVNQALVDNPSLVQASGSATNTGDNSVALQLADLATATQSSLNNQTFTGSYNASVDTLGAALQDANSQVTDQTKVNDMLSTQRGSVSGVNVDEEMTNMMTFQRAYQASAQVVTTVNTMFGDLLAMKTS